jgi:hypothetical protein
MAEVAKQLLTIYQSTAANCLVYQNAFVASIRSIALSVTDVFGSTYLCEEAFF